MTIKMIKYTEQLLTSPLKTSSGFKSTSPTPPGDFLPNLPTQDNRISLTPLWEYVVRTKSLPDGLDLDVFFQAIQERLRNPEREVRQHALRVLMDFIPVIEGATLDAKMEIIMSDLVANLGHIGPAVRKGAIDCLRVYLIYSKSSESVLRDLVYSGLEKAHENKMRTNTVVGIIIALPFLVKRATQELLLYIIRMLFEKMVHITFQEITLRSLVRIRDILGDEKFNECIKFSGSNSTRRDFDLLCEVYDVNGRNVNDNLPDNSPHHTRSCWNDFNQNVIEQCGWKSDAEVVIRKNQNEIIQDKVILETEIKLNSGPAITMQIHEESRQSISDASKNDNRSNMGIVKVLPDESEEDYEPRRTPRRVRFGGEIVKLRTPDSDSNQPSDFDNDSTITITPREDNDDKPIIEIHYTDTKTNRSLTLPKSNIPVLNSKRTKTVRSEPNSPLREPKIQKDLSNSSPNLSKSQILDKASLSRIPRSVTLKDPTNVKTMEKQSSHTTTIQIKFREPRSTKATKKEKLKETPKEQEAPKEKESTKEKEASALQNSETHTEEKNKNEKPKNTLKIKLPTTKSNKMQGSDEENLSPETAHREIEMFHNLTRSPEIRDSEPKFEDPVGQEEEAKPVTFATPAEKLTSTLVTTTTTTISKISAKTTPAPTTVTSSKVEAEFEDRHLTTADNVLLNREINKPPGPRNIHTADQAIKSAKNYNSFQVMNCRDSPIPTSNLGDCLTCSSSGSDNLVPDTSWEDVGVIDDQIINNLKSKDDWKIRLKGLEELNKVLQNQSSVELLEPKAASLLHFLFSCEQHSRLQPAAEDILKILFTKMQITTLQGRLNQIVMSLCKMGSPAGVRLSILLMRRISAEEFLNQLLGSSILGAKSSKVREGALQILMTISRIFPSTEVNVPKAIEFVTPLLKDRKKRVRRASLEAIAALAQLGTTGAVLDGVLKISASYEDKEQLLKVVRTRLSRKQLPSVDLNGSVRYSTPSGDSELEWISIGSATTSPQSFKHTAVPEADEDNFKIQRDESVDSNNASFDSAPPFALMNGHRANYWKNNARRTETNESVDKSQEENDSDWSRSSGEAKDDLKNQNLQIWAVDPWTLSTPVKLSTTNGTLRPLFLVQREQLQSTNSRGSSPNCEEKEGSIKQKRSPRGRSFSPPKKQNELKRNEERERFVKVEKDSQSWRSPKLQKSISSDHIRSNVKTFSGSTSSSNSGASVRSGGWHKSFKSGIPVPVSSDSRLRFKTRQGEVTSKGPVSIPPQFYSFTLTLKEAIAHPHVRTMTALIENDYVVKKPDNLWGLKEEPEKSSWSAFPTCCAFLFRSKKIVDISPPKSGTPVVSIALLPDDVKTKSPSSQGTPERAIISQRAVLVRQPFSSGSESSEFYTPPAEPHLPTNLVQPAEDIVLQSPRQSESFIEVDSPRYHNENFTVIDDNPSVVLEQNLIFARPDSSTSISDNDNEAPAIKKEDSFQVEDEFETEEIYEASGIIQESLEMEDEDKPKENLSNSLDELDGYEAPRNFVENRTFSKSEINLQISPEPSRKSVNSAPALNDMILQIRYEVLEDTKTGTLQPNTLQTTMLPGAVGDLSPKLEDEAEAATSRNPARVLKPTLSRQLSRKNSVRGSKKDSTPFPEILSPFPRPKEGFNETLVLMDHSDWEMTMKGLQGIMRLTRHHPEMVENHLHVICRALGKQIRNLRSQVARSACLAASEMFGNHKKALEMDLEELAVPLLHRTADTNKFLRGDANAALDAMSLNIPPPRVVAVVAIKGGGHQNAIVRCTAARILCSLTNRLGVEKVFQLPKDTRDRILLCGANMLLEGNLETRKHAKMMISNLSTHSQFNRAMSEAVPLCTMRHIQKTLKALQ